MEIDYKNLIVAKITRLDQLHKGGNFSHDFRGHSLSEEVVEANVQKKKTFVTTKGEVRTREMLGKIKEMGYVVAGGRITQAGVHSLVGERAGIKFFGFVCPTGKLRLSVQRPGTKRGQGPNDIVLEINYQRVNLKVHDRFLSVVMQRI